MKPSLPQYGLLDVARERGNRPGAVEQAQAVVRGLLDFAPGIGDALAAKDAYDSFNNPDDPWWKTGLLGVGALPFIPTIGHTVWHGSPHLFNKFDSSKIGTGEGAQAYGHGLYTAESPDVAQEYRRRLSPDLTIKAKSVDSAYKHAAQSFKDYGSSFEETLQGLKSAYKDADPGDIEAAAREVFGESYGNLYKADIPDEWLPRMLDWDKPLSEQSKEVREAITALARSDDEIMDAIQKHGGGNMRGDVFYAAMQDLFTGRNKQKAVAAGENAANWSPDDIRRFASGNDAYASSQLNQYGIPGLRYLDGSSRNAGEGTYNYVIFPGMEDQVKILERNGNPL